MGDLARVSRTRSPCVAKWYAHTSRQAPGGYAYRIPGYPGTRGLGSASRSAPDSDSEPGTVDPQEGILSP
eukprot:1547187-Rhodomonas_salina.1